MFKKKPKAADGACAPAPTTAGEGGDGRQYATYTLPEFEQFDTLGTGTFGRVRLVQHKESKKYSALKILKKSEIIRLKQVDHIKSEVTLLKMISHPFVVNLIGHFQDEKKLYMVLEYVPGGELFSHLRREGRLTDDHGRYYYYAAEIALAFAHMHAYNHARYNNKYKCSQYYVCVTMGQFWEKTHPSSPGQSRNLNQQIRSCPSLALVM